MKTRTAFSRRRTRGFTLLEVLIAAVVLAIGLLGIASLQLTAKRAGHQAWQRGLAISYANDIIERIRINPSAAASYHTGMGKNALGGGTLDTPAEDCDATTCSPAQLATWDLWRWERQLDGETVTDENGEAVGGLINPSGCIAFTAASADLPNTGSLRVVVSWQSTTETSDAAQVASDVCGAAAAGSTNSRRQLSINTYIIDTKDLDP